MAFGVVARSASTKAHLCGRSTALAPTDAVDLGDEHLRSLVAGVPAVPFALDLRAA
jgi:hypothetical protein